VECKDLSTTEMFKTNFWMKCYPNPTSATLTFSYSLYKNSDIKIEILDLSGRTVGLIEDAPNSQGEHSIDYDFGRLVNGTYLIKLMANDTTLTEKIMLYK
jgi:hypothetical protein